jgi:hypothetical protein
MALPGRHLEIAFEAADKPRAAKAMGLVTINGELIFRLSLNHHQCGDWRRLSHDYSRAHSRPACEEVQHVLKGPALAPLEAD